MVLEKVEAVAKTLLVPVLKKHTPSTTKTTYGTRPVGKSYPTCFWRVSFIKGRECTGFSIITRSLTMEIEQNFVQMIRTGPPEVSKPSRELILRD